MNEIFYNPATQYVNTGDLLINKTLVGFLRENGTLYADDNNKPKWFIDELLKQDDLRLSKFTKADSINYVLKLLIRNKLTGRNKNIKYYFVFVPGHLAKSGFRGAISSLKIFFKFLSLRMLGCRLIRVGISLGNFDRPNAFVEALITRCYSYFAVRDHVSIENARKYNFKTPEYFPDFGWAYKHEEISTREEIYEPGADGFVVMSFRANELGHGIQTEVYDQLLSSIKKLLNSGVLSKYKLVLSYQVGSDREANFKLFQELSQDFDNVSFFDTKLLLDNAFDLYSRADFLITNRLHVMLLAVQAKTIAFSLIDQKANSKIYNILKDNQLLDLVLQVNDYSKSNSRKISQVLSNSDSISGKLNNAIDANTAEIRNKISSIFKEI